MGASKSLQRWLQEFLDSLPKHAGCPLKVLGEGFGSTRLQVLKHVLVRMQSSLERCSHQSWEPVLHCRVR